MIMIMIWLEFFTYDPDDCSGRICMHHCNKKNEKKRRSEQPIRRIHDEQKE